MRWLALTIGCAGCPFLWGPPEFAYPDHAGDADVDADSDADSDADTDADPPTHEPVLSSFGVELAYDQVTLTFSVTDPDGDIEGGKLALSEGGDLAGTYSIGPSLASWDGTTGTVVLEEQPDCGGYQRDYDLVAIDLADHASASASAALVVEGWTMAENGSAITTLGPVSPPAIFCGNQVAPNDTDVWDATLANGGTLTMYLDHPGTVADVALLDSYGAPVVVSVPGSPDAFSFPFEAGTTYRFKVQTAGSSSAGYTAVISR